jgi:subtilase family serine protease
MKKQCLVSAVLIILTIFLTITAAYGADSSTNDNTISNSVSSSSFNEQNGPDLIITNLTAPSGGALGGQIIVPNTVKNQGNNTAGGFYVAYYLTPEKNIDNITYLGFQQIQSNDYFGYFVAGASKSDNTLLNIPHNIPVGEYYIVALADSYESVNESDENNNWFFSTAKINIQSGNDLLITSITVPANGIRDRTITVTNTVKNQGNLAASGFYVTYYLTTTPNLNEKTKIGTRYITSLAAGATNTDKTILNIPSTVKVGQYYIAAVADSTQLINEVNEANNNRYSSYMINVQDGRDLLIDSISTVAIGVPGRTITVTNTVKNQGNLAASGFYVTYYLTTTPNLNEKTKIGTRYITSLAAGATNTDKTILNIPSTVKVGQYYIAAVADSTQLINEVNEANNNRYSAGKITVTIDNVITIVQLNSAALSVSNYYETHSKQLPSSLTINGVNYNIAQLLYLLTTATINMETNNLKPITVKTVNKAPNPSGTIKNGNIMKTNYISYAKDIQKFINTNGRAPNFVSTNLGNMQFKYIVYMYSQVVNFYVSKNRLPNYVNLDASSSSNQQNPPINVITIAQLGTAAASVCNYYETHSKQLPSSLTINGVNYNIAQLLYLLTTATINMETNNLKPITVKTVNKAPNPSGTIKNGNIMKTNYISYAKDIQKFINTNGRSPNFISTNLGKMQFKYIVYMYSQVVNFYISKNRLPNYVTMSK